MTNQLIRYDQIANSANGNLTVVLGTIYDKANLGGNTCDVYANGASLLPAKKLNFINTSSVQITVTDKGDGNANVGFTTAIPGVVIQIACSDLLSSLATLGVAPTTNMAYFRCPKAFTLTTLRASLGNAATDGGDTNSCNIQVYMNGANVLTTGSGQLKLNQGSNTSVGATSPYVIANATFVDDGLVQIQACNIGNGANGLIVTFVGS